MCTTVVNKNNKNELVNGKVEKMCSHKSEVFTNNVRFWISVLVIIHATLLSTRLFSIDFSKSEIEELRHYHQTRWQLTTVWFSLLLFAYYIVTIYCEWKEKSGGRPLEPHVVKLNEARHFIFTSLVLPSVLFSNTIFWKMWTANRLLVVPLAVDNYVTVFDQHLLHTVSSLIVIFDCILMDRKKPKNKKLHFGLLFMWATLYHSVLHIATLHGDFVYPLLKTYSPTDKILICIMSYAGHFFYYFVQWRFNGFLMKYILSKIRYE